MKYDVFVGDKPNVLEVDASTEEIRDAFDPSDFPGSLTEVTGDIQYYGYRMAEDKH